MSKNNPNKPTVFSSVVEKFIQFCIGYFSDPDFKEYSQGVYHSSINLLADDPNDLNSNVKRHHYQLIFRKLS